MTSTRTERPRSGRRLVIVFYLGLIGLTFGLSWWAIRRPKHQAYREGRLLPVTRCIEVVDGQTLRIEDRGEKEKPVRLRGILSPAHAGDRFPAARSRAQEESITTGILQGWVYRKRVEVSGNALVTANGVEQEFAYVRIFGTDVGAKLLEEGQAVADSGAHPNLDRYLEFEADARHRKKGIWR